MDSKLSEHISFSSSDVSRIREKLDMMRQTPDARIEHIGLDHDNYKKLRQMGVKTVGELAHAMDTNKVSETRFACATA